MDCTATRTSSSLVECAGACSTLCLLTVNQTYDMHEEQVSNGVKYEQCKSRDAPLLSETLQNKMHARNMK